MIRDPGPMIPGRQAPPPKPKRFYAHAATEERDGAHALLLDGRPAKTPAKRTLALPSRAAAEALAAEWSAQAEVIDPARMPLTRLSNTAIDGVAGQMAAVAAEVKTYLGSDLLLYAPIDTLTSGDPGEDLPLLGTDALRADLQPRATVDGDFVP